MFAPILLPEHRQKIVLKKQATGANPCWSGILLGAEMSLKRYIAVKVSNWILKHPQPYHLNLFSANSLDKIYCQMRPPKNMTGIFMEKNRET